jgi:predicted DNA-binding transcriptional regulator AlpA
MQNLLLTQISDVEIRQLFREELENFFAENKIGENKAGNDEIGGIDVAIKLTGLAKPTIYSLCSERKIPHSKQGKRLYFSRLELLEWIKNGKRKTNAEIAVEAENYEQKVKEAFPPSKQRNRFLKVKENS